MVRNHAFHFKMRITMTDASSGRKPVQQSMYNSMPKTKTLLLMIAEQDPGLSITSLNGNSTLSLSSPTPSHAWKHNSSSTSTAIGKRPELHPERKSYLGAS